MTTYNLSSISIQGCAPAVNSIAQEPNTDSIDLDTREDALLRAGNGIRDALVFPRLRAMGVAESDLHRTSMKYVRQVQYGCDEDGAIAAFLGVVRCYPLAHGTIAASEVD